MNGLPPQPWAPLDAEQRGHALGLLQAYLTDHFRYGHHFNRPEYVLLEASYLPDEAPEGYSAGETGRRGKGSYVDPTYRAARELLDGPTPIVLTTPYFTRIPHDLMRDLLDALPTHQREPIRVAIILRKGHVGAERVLTTMSYKTIGRRCDEGLDALLGMLYGARWAPGESAVA